MTIETIRDNLRDTIASKKNLLNNLSLKLRFIKSRPDIIATETTIKFLELNIAELEKIIKEVEECCID